MSETPVTAPAVEAIPNTAEAVSEDVLPANPTGEQAKEFFERQKKKNPIPFPKKERDPERKTEESAPKEEKLETPSEVKKYKVKVSGQELEVDEKELLRGYSHQRAANQILQEGKKAQREAQQFIDMLKNKESFFDVASKLGLNPRELAEEYLVRQLEDEMLDPKEKELRQYKKRVEEFEALETKKREEVEKQHQEELKNKYAQDYNQQFVKALQETKLPPTKTMVAEMAKYISRSAKIGFEMSALEAAQLVRQDLLEAQRRLVGDADGEAIIQLLGSDVANKIRQYDTSKIKSPEKFLKTPKDQPDKRISSNRGSRMTQAEWMMFKRGL